MNASTTTTGTPISKGALRAGWIISGLCILFFLFDSITKIIKEHHSVEGSAAIGWPVDAVQGIGITLLISTILFIIPRTVILGAILITGYLGGAVAIMVRVGEAFYFPVALGVLVWLGLWLRNVKVRTILA